MRNRTRRMTQTATYWGPGQDDGLGGVTFPAPILFAPDQGGGVRWQAKSELFRDEQGNEVASTAVVYVPQAVETEGYLALGDHTDVADPRTLAGADEVRQTGASPNLRGTEQLHKAWL